MLVAYVLTGASSVASFHRELMRNPTLVKICGGSTSKEFAKAVPTKSALYRFWKKVRERIGKIEEIVSKMVKEIQGMLPDFGKEVAVDSTVIHSGGRRIKWKEEEGDKRDDRRENDARWGKKEYYSAQGELLKKEVYLGFKLHTVVDAKYEIPLSFKVTPADVSDTKELLPLMEKLQESNPELVQKIEYLSADRGYTGEKTIGS